MKLGRTYYLHALLAFGILLLINLFGSNFILRVDLTQEGRYTLSPVSRQTLDSLARLPYTMTVKVYLEGAGLPAAAKRYRDAVNTTLQEMKVLAGDRLDIQFIDPSNNAALQRHLSEQGVPAIPVSERKGDSEVRHKLIFPGAVVNYQGKEQIVNLLFGYCHQRSGGVFDCNYDAAQSDIEYKLISQMQRVLPGQKRIVGLLTSHGCLQPEEMKEFVGELRQFYDIMGVSLRGGKGIPASRHFLPDSIKQRLTKDAEGIDVLIIARPDSVFSEDEKFELDQYIMQGGRVLWLVDNTVVDERDFENRENPSTLTILRDLKLDDMFFRYGFRVGSNLMEDMQAGRKHVMMDLPGSEGSRGPRPVPVPYPYYVMVSGPGIRPHEITKSIEAVELRYASTLDTLYQADLKYYPLLRTSPYSRAKEGVQHLDFQNIMAFRPPKELFAGKGERMVGLALEGTFHSVFTQRQKMEEVTGKAKERAFLPETAYGNRMVIFGDGDLPIADNSFMGNKRIPWNNKQLLLNSVDWLVGDKTFNQIRARNVVVRELDADKTGGKAWLYQVLNIVIPVLLVILWGILHSWRRRKRNQRLRQVRV